MSNAITARRLTLSVLVGLVTVALVVVVPRTVGATWTTVAGPLARISLVGLGGLAVLWIAGLWAYSFVLAASLPGLSKRRALTLNVTGSAVANVLPLGGAVGTRLNFAMTRRWGFSPAAFAGFLTVTTMVNVVAKLCVVAVALALAPIVHSATALPAGRTGLLLLPVLTVLALVAWVLASAAAAAGCGRGIDGVVGVVCSGRRSRLEMSLPRLRRSVLRVFRSGWRSISAGAVGYLLLQAALLWLCLHLVGLSLGVPALLTGLAVDRLLTLVVFTPGGAGVVEIGTVAALVALGGAPVAVTAGVVLYRGFTCLLEIPVGGTTLAIWLLHNRRRVAAVMVSGERA